LPPSIGEWELDMFSKWISRLLMAAVLACGPLCANSFAQTAIIGGPGGGAFKDHCGGDNSYLVGITADVDKDLKTVQPVCQAFVNGHAVGAQAKGSAWGNGKSNGRYTLLDTVSCPPDMAVQGLIVQVSHVNLVHTYALLCRNPMAHDYKTTKFLQTIGGQSAYQKQTDCGGGAIANGLIGRYGANVDGMGLDCKVLAH
jgi:hypothetical protein